jgi:hypothetical protein
MGQNCASRCELWADNLAHLEPKIGTMLPLMTIATSLRGSALLVRRSAASNQPRAPLVALDPHSHTPVRSCVGRLREAR